MSEQVVYWKKLFNIERYKLKYFAQYWLYRFFGIKMAKLKDPMGISTATTSPDGAKVLTYGSDENSIVRLWELKTGKPLLELKHNKPVKLARFSPNGIQILTIVEGQRGRIWNAVTGDEEIQLYMKGGIVDAAFRSDGRQIVGVSRSSVQLFDTSTGECLKSLAEQSGDFSSVQFNASGTRVFAGLSRSEVNIAPRPT